MAKSENRTSFKRAVWQGAVQIGGLTTLWVAVAGSLLHVSSPNPEDDHWSRRVPELGLKHLFFCAERVCEGVESAIKDQLEP